MIKASVIESQQAQLPSLRPPRTAFSVLIIRTGGTVATVLEFDMAGAAGRGADGEAAGRITDGAHATGHRQRMARVCRRAGLLPFMAWLRSAMRDDLRILAYHRVLETAEPEGFRFDPELVSASADGFREQLLSIRRHCTPMRFDELLECYDRGRRLPKRAVLITFDDGYDDNYRVAFPLLRDAGISAMFFVSTGHIDSGRPYAYDWLVHMICTVRADRCELPELNFAQPLEENLTQRRQVAAMVLDRIKTLTADEQQALIDRLSYAWGIPADVGHRDCRPMNWEQLREMRRGGMEIGSHGVNHRMLAKLPADDMRRELLHSKQAIERELGVGVVAVSYPVGGHDAYNDDVIRVTEATGYRLACSYLSGAQPLDAQERYAMKRIPVERQTDIGWFEGMLAAPELFCHPSRRRKGRS